MFVQTVFIPYYLSTDIDFVCVLCTSSSAADVAYLSLPLSLCLCSGVPHTISHFCTYPFIFSQLQRSVCTNSIYCLLPLWQVLFCDVTTGLILCTPLYATNKIDIFYRGMLRRSRRLQIFFKITTAPQSPPPTLEAR